MNNIDNDLNSYYDLRLDKIKQGKRYDYKLLFINNFKVPKLRYSSLKYLIEKEGTNNTLTVDRYSNLTLTNSDKIFYYISSRAILKFYEDNSFEILDTKELIELCTTSNNYANRRLFDFTDISLGYYKTYSKLDFPNFLDSSKHSIMYTPMPVLTYNYETSKFQLLKEENTYIAKRTNLKAYLTTGTKYIYESNLDTWANANEVNWVDRANKAGITKKLNKLIEQLLASTGKVIAGTYLTIKVRLDTLETIVFLQRESLRLERVVAPEIKDLFTRAGLTNEFSVLNIKIDLSKYTSLDLLKLTLPPLTLRV